MSPSRLTDQVPNEEEISILAGRVSNLCAKLTKAAADEETTAIWKPNATFEGIRALVNDATTELLNAINGPQMTLRTLCFSHYDLAALQLALDRGFFHHMPLPLEMDGEKLPWPPQMEYPTISVADLAAKVNLDEDRTVRVLRLLATQNIFEEVRLSLRRASGPPDDGNNSNKPSSSSSPYSSILFRHTPNSAFVKRDQEFHAMADMQLDHMFCVSAEASKVARRFPQASDMEKPDFEYKFGMPSYEYIEQSPADAARFAKAMNSLSKMDRQIQHLCDSFDWESLGNAKVVDIGGGSGHISIALSQRFQSLRFIVQDISPKMLAHTINPIQDTDTTTTTTKTATATQSVSDTPLLEQQHQQQHQHQHQPRVTFQRHDFFTAQPVRDASVYLLRQCLHNYADADAARIVAAVVPALEEQKGEEKEEKEEKAAACLLISDIVLPDKDDKDDTVTRFEERRVRQMDFCMMLAFGARQRSRADLERLLKGVDERLRIVRVHRNAFGAGLVEVRLG